MFSVCLPLSQFNFRNAMIERRFVDDWPWAPKMIIYRKYRLKNQLENPAYRPDCKKVKHISCTIEWKQIQNNTVMNFLQEWICKFVSWMKLHLIMKVPVQIVNRVRNYQNHLHSYHRQVVHNRATVPVSHCIHIMRDRYRWRRVNHMKKVSICTIWYWIYLYFGKLLNQQFITWHSIAVRPSNSANGQPTQIDEDPKDIDFFTKQARLQIEARMALAQAKDMAHMQMEVSELRGWLPRVLDWPELNLKFKCIFLCIVHPKCKEAYVVQ